MIEKKRTGETLLERILTSEIGSPESRAAARQLVEEPRRAPNVLLVFVNAGPRDDSGELLGPVEFNSQTAEIFGGDGKLFRLEGESHEQFQQRVYDALPAIGMPGLGYMYPCDPPPATA